NAICPQEGVGIRSPVVPTKRRRARHPTETDCDGFTASGVFHWVDMPSKREQLIELDAGLRRRIRGQNEGLKRLMEAIRRRELNAVPQPGAGGCYIFAGPTGVGKTETARMIGDVLYGPDSLLRIDCSEYKTLESIQTLLGD